MVGICDRRHDGIYVPFPPHLLCLIPGLLSYEKGTSSKGAGEMREDVWDTTHVSARFGAQRRTYQALLVFKTDDADQHKIFVFHYFLADPFSIRRY